MNSFAPIALALLLVASPCFAQETELVELAPARLLVGRIEAMPQIAKPRTQATKRANVALRRMDARWLKDRAGCRGPKTGPHPVADRSHTATMLGPKFVSIRVWYEYACLGTAHPSFYSETLTIDLSSGAALDWATTSPAATSRLSDHAAGGDHQLSTELIWPALSAVYFRRVQERAVADARTSAGDAEWWEDCKEALDRPDGAFQVTPNPEAHGVSVSPAWLPHAAMACGEPLLLKPADLLDLGVSPHVVEAVETAHRLRAYQPSEPERP